IVSRELTGMIPAVSLNADVARVGVGQLARVPIAPIANDAENIVPSMSIPGEADQDMDYLDLTIQKSKARPFSWNGEERRALGQNYSGIINQQFAQAIRALVNEVESDLCALHI